METKSCSFSKVNSRVTLLNLFHLNINSLKRANRIQENPYHEGADTHTNTHTSRPASFSKRLLSEQGYRNES